MKEGTGTVPQVAYVPDGAPTPPGSFTPPAPDDVAGTWKEFLPLQGQVVSITQVGSVVPFNGQLEKVAEHGIEMMNGGLKLSWDKIASIEMFEASKHTPGYKPPNLTPEEKAAAKEAKRVAAVKEKADKAAAKVVDRENQRAADKAAKKAAAEQAKAAAQGQPPAAAVPTTPPTLPTPAQPPAPAAPPLFKPQDAIQHLDAAIQSLQQMRQILSQV